MSEDTSLDQFLNADDSDSEGDADDAGSDEQSPTQADEQSPPDAEEEEATVAPATSTYSFEPDGAVCESCGEAVQTRWRDEDALVCASCKDW